MLHSTTPHVSLVRNKLEHFTAGKAVQHIHAPGMIVGTPGLGSHRAGSDPSVPTLNLVSLTIGHFELGLGGRQQCSGVDVERVMEMQRDGL